MIYDSELAVNVPHLLLTITYCRPKPFEVLGLFLSSSSRDTFSLCVTWKKYQDQGHLYKIPDEIDDMVRFITTKTYFVSDL